MSQLEEKLSPSRVVEPASGGARGLAEAGCRVTIGGRHLEPLEEVAKSSSLHTLVMPPSTSPHRKRFHIFQSIRTEVGEVDILVNSAGINIQKRTMAEMSPKIGKSTCHQRIGSLPACMKCSQQCVHERMVSSSISPQSLENEHHVGWCGLRPSKFA